MDVGIIAAEPEELTSKEQGMQKMLILQSAAFVPFTPDRFERRESRDNNLVDMSIFSFIVSLRVAKRLLRGWQGRFMSLCIKSKSSFIALL